MRRILIVAIACLLLGCGLGTARETYNIYGQGTQSCGKWTEHNKATRDMELYVWAVGFVSGAGYVSSTPLRKTDSDALVAWVDKYCVEHPLDTVAKATGMLVTELKQK